MVVLGGWLFLMCEVPLYSPNLETRNPKPNTSPASVSPKPSTPKPYTSTPETQSPNPKPYRQEREFFIDNLLVRIHFIIMIIRWTGLAPWEFGFPFPGSLTSTFLAQRRRVDSIHQCIRHPLGTP